MRRAHAVSARRRCVPFATLSSAAGASRPPFTQPPCRRLQRGRAAAGVPRLPRAAGGAQCRGVARGGVPRRPHHRGGAAPRRRLPGLAGGPRRPAAHAAGELRRGGEGRSWRGARPRACSRSHSPCLPPGRSSPRQRCAPRPAARSWTCGTTGRRRSTPRPSAPWSSSWQARWVCAGWQPRLPCWLAGCCQCCSRPLAPFCCWCTAALLLPLPCFLGNSTSPPPYSHTPPCSHTAQLRVSAHALGRPAAAGGRLGAPRDHPHVHGAQRAPPEA